MEHAATAGMMRNEQIKLLYESAPFGFVAVVINAFIVVIVEWDVLSHAWLLGWLGYVLALTGVRAHWVRRFNRRPSDDLDLTHWGRLFLIGTFLSGLGWGAAGVLLFAEGSLAHQAFLAFVLGGMTAGAITTLSAMMNAFLCFVLPALLPTAARFLLAGEPVSSAMGWMVAIYTLLTLFIAWKLNTTILTFLRLRFENQDLVASLTAGKTRMEQLNAELKIEITERTMAEKELRAARDELEHRVQSRTGELAKTATALRSEIDERQRASAALQESQQRLQAILDNTTALISLKDFYGRYLLVNRQAQSLFNAPRESILGKTDHDLFPPQIAEMLRANDQQVLQTIKPLEVEEIVPHADGPHTYLSIKFPLLDATGGLTGICAISTDITNRKRAETSIALQAKELARSNAELEQFAYVSSHDLQEPLRMVASYTQLLAKRYKGRLDADADEFVQYILDGVTRMQALIRDLLAYSHIGKRPAPHEPVDCGAVFNQALDNLKVAIEESGAVVTADALPIVQGDALQLIQLFQNLVGNAVKFHDQATPTVHVSAQREGQEWLFSVADNGIGIDPLYAERIFVIFQRLHGREEYTGTGIGLAICKRIVEGHGGRIWVESEPGKGATFYFTIPHLT